MPPSLLLLALVAIAVPATARALLGRPRSQLAAIAASVAGVTLAQAVGEVVRATFGVIGDAQVGWGLLASAFATTVVALVEGPHTRRRNTEKGSR